MNSGAGCGERVGVRLVRSEGLGLRDLGGLGSSPEVLFTAHSVKFLALEPSEQVDAAGGPLDQFGRLRRQRAAAEAEFVRRGSCGTSPTVRAIASRNRASIGF